MRQRGLEGSRLVLVLYAVVVAVAGTLGALFALVVENPSAPAYLLVVDLPPTPLGFALYGSLTVATALGVPLLFVVFVLARIDQNAVEEN